MGSGFLEFRYAMESLGLSSTHSLNSLLGFSGIWNWIKVVRSLPCWSWRFAARQRSRSSGVDFVAGVRLRIWDGYCSGGRIRRRIVTGKQIGRAHV